MTAREQAEVAWEFYNRPEHMGGFSHTLCTAWIRADVNNKSQLAAGFPILAMAFGHFYASDWPERKDFVNAVLAEHHFRRTEEDDTNDGR